VTAETASRQERALEVGVLGASGYVGAELVRLLAGHPDLQVAALTGDRNAGRAAEEVFPHLAGQGLPRLQRLEQADLEALDFLFMALPHGVAQTVLMALPDDVQTVDLSADFRLRSVDAYESWYGAAHLCPFALDAFVYGLPEINRSEIRSAQMVACTGCYVAGALTPLVPLVRAELIDADDIVIDSKSGASGAGRALRESLLFCEVGEGCAAYSIGRHRHMAELEQELSRSAGRSVRVSFTPHLMPFSRGILSTQYVRGDALAIHRHLDKTFAEEPFVRLLPFGQVPRTQEVRGSNVIAIGVAADRRIGRAILVSALDNLVKGSAGQAVQNANLMLGLEETRGLPVLSLIP